MRAMADPLSGVYKAGQSPSFAAGRRPWGRTTAAGEVRAPSAARADYDGLNAAWTVDTGVRRKNFW